MNILFAGSSNESRCEVRDCFPQVLQISHTPHTVGNAKHTNRRSQRPFLHRLFNSINGKHVFATTCQATNRKFLHRHFWEELIKPTAVLRIRWNLSITEPQGTKIFVSLKHQNSPPHPESSEVPLNTDTLRVHHRVSRSSGQKNYTTTDGFPLCSRFRLQ